MEAGGLASHSYLSGDRSSCEFIRNCRRVNDGATRDGGACMHAFLNDARQSCEQLFSPNVRVFRRNKEQVGDASSDFNQVFRHVKAALL